MTELTCFNHYLLEYLLVSDDIEKDLGANKNIICSINFLEFLEYLVEYDSEENYLSKEMRKNIDKLFLFLNVYLEDNRDYYKKIESKYKDQPESGMFYLNQFLLKYNNIEDFKNNKCVLWDKKEMNASVRYDFGFLIMVLSDKKTYIEKYFNNLLYNQEFIYFTKRLLVQYPEVAYKIKDRVISVLELNDGLNFDVKDNNIVLEQYINLNKKNNYNIFTICNFIEEYNQIKIEDSIINNREEEFNPLMFDYLKRFVEDLEDSEFSKSMKDSLIDILSSIRPKLSKDLLDEYNNLLITINSKKIGHINKNSVISANHVISKYGIIEYLKIFVKKEIEDTSLGIENDKKVMDYIIGDLEKEQIGNYDECYATINRFVHENKPILKSPLVHSKLTELLEYVLSDSEVKEDNKLYKKIKKSYKKVNEIY